MSDLAIREFQSVRIGRKIFPFTSCEEISKAYRSTIEHLALGASESPPCDILNARSEVVGHVSYNGKVWLGSGVDWKPGEEPIFNPYSKEA